MAAEALNGTPGPWAPGSPNLGVRSRENSREDAVLNQRYVQPAQARADGVVTAAQLRAQGKSAEETTRILIAQLNQQTEIYKAQMTSAGVDQQTQARLIASYQRSNAEIIASGGDPIPFSQFHSQATSMLGQGPMVAPPVAPISSTVTPNPMGAQPPMPPQAPVRPAVAAMPPQVQQILNAGLTPEEWARFDRMPPADQQAFLQDVAAGRASP